MESDILQLNKEEYQKIIDSFKTCAKNGKISEEQFNQVLATVIGDRMQHVSLSKLWTRFESSNDKTVDYIELVMALAFFFKGSLFDCLTLQA
jgi:Ca2+-binding EF-hand superfamily protein